jgi:uncharacterized membrane protein
MKKYLFTFVAICIASSAFACISCNKKVRDGIFNSAFYPNLFVILSAFLVLAIVIIVLVVITNKRTELHSPVPLTTASMVLGIGMGGFIDGIVLHQILQWHEMLSNKIPTNEYVGKSINMFWDGIFHFFCLIVVLVGIILMWKLLFRKDINHSGRLLTGGLLLGWGLFNIIEGLIDHHLLKLHNVVELSPNHDTGNYIFLGISILMIFLGYWLFHKEKSNQSLIIK